MLTPVQRTAILGFAAESDPDPSSVTNDDIWYGFLSSLFGAGKTLKDLKLSPAQQPEIMACLRRAPSVAPRTFNRGNEQFVRSTPASGPARTERS
ncbi:MAG: hypothetical protein M3137_02215 [Actinomycetota bacterium]|nr:hypothetical protein [Actinomycetota bacterium]